MILIFGGTTEGRSAANICDSAHKPFFYSTKSGNQVVMAAHISILYGDMCCADMVEFCTSNQIKLIVDASHPFASALHNNIAESATILQIPTIRYDRLEQEINSECVRYCDSIDMAIEKIVNSGYKRLLSLTGVNSSKKLLSISDRVDLRLRIMDRSDSWDLIKESGFPIDKLIVYDENSNEEELFNEILPDVILLKESGKSGSYAKKVALATKLNIDILVITRPQLPHYNSIVYGEYGLRRAIDELLPEYFALRTGFTTGSCATAAAVAALLTAIGKEVDRDILFLLPNGEPLSMEVNTIELTQEGVKATVIKDAGDDPDVTHRLDISAEVILDYDLKEVRVTGGEGVGVVTLPGLGIEVGDSAINKIPHKMITENIAKILKLHNYSCGVRVIVSVPEGKEVAKRTFNSRLGILNGISILGTSGIVQPFSNEAFLESIRRQIDVVKALGYSRIIINSGAKSEGYLKSHYHDTAKEAFVQYGNLIGDTLKVCEEQGINDVVLGVMLGKAVKLANGDLDTHSKRSSMDKEFLLNLSEKSGCGTEVKEMIKKMVVARALWDIIPPERALFFELLKRSCYGHCKSVFSSGNIEIVLIKEHGELL